MTRHVRKVKLPTRSLFWTSLWWFELSWKLLVHIQPGMVTNFSWTRVSSFNGSSNESWNMICKLWELCVNLGWDFIDRSSESYQNNDFTIRVLKLKKILRIITMECHLRKNRSVKGMKGLMEPQHRCERTDNHHQKMCP